MSRKSERIAKKKLEFLPAPAVPLKSSSLIGSKSNSDKLKEAEKFISELRKKVFYRSIDYRSIPPG